MAELQVESELSEVEKRQAAARLVVLDGEKLTSLYVYKPQTKKEKLEALLCGETEDPPWKGRRFVNITEGEAMEWPKGITGI